VHRFGGMDAVRRRARVPAPVRRRGDREQWDGECVTREIRALYDEGEPLASSKAPKKLVHAGIRYYGTWAAAIEAAGLEYERVRLTRPPYSKKELLAMVRRVAERHPRMTLKDFWQRFSWSQRLRELFGTVENAAAKAGLSNWPARQTPPLPSRRQTIALLRALAKSGPPMVAKSDLRLWEAVTRHFSSWRNRLEAA